MEIFYIENIYTYKDYICGEKQIMRIVDKECCECIVVYIKLSNVDKELRMINTYTGEDILIKIIKNENNIINNELIDSHYEKIKLMKNLEEIQQYMLYSIYL